MEVSLSPKAQAPSPPTTKAAPAPGYRWSLVRPAGAGRVPPPPSPAPEAPRTSAPARRPAPPARPRPPAGGAPAAGADRPRAVRGPRAQARPQGAALAGGRPPGRAGGPPNPPYLPRPAARH